MVLHPAHKYKPIDLYNLLISEVKNGNVNVLNVDNMHLFNYSKLYQHSVYGNVWPEHMIMSRGIVIDPVANKYVALPFPKFFNFGEEGKSPPNEKYTVLEKYDGSLGIIYFYNNEWRVNTRGSFGSIQAKFGLEYIRKNNIDQNLNKNYTYLCEIICQDSKMVIPYDSEYLVLIGYYDNNTFEEYCHVDDLINEANRVGFVAPKYFNFNSIDEIVSQKPLLPFDNEGYVIRFNNGYRLKVKGDKYCHIHAVIANCTPLHIWKTMCDGDDMYIENFKSELPEEVYDLFEYIYEDLKSQYNKIYNSAKKFYTDVQSMSDKEVGLYLSQLKSVRQYEDYMGLIFTFRKNPERLKPSILRMIRPIGNNILQETHIEA